MQHSCIKNLLQKEKIIGIIFFLMFSSFHSVAFGQFSPDDKWGVFIHFIPDSAMNRFPKDFTPEKWNDWVNNFDAKGLAKQLSTTGADYAFITVEHHAGYFCSPNRTVDSIVKWDVSHCSKRDLVMDLAKELRKYNIKPCVYIQSRAPDGDSLSVAKLKWKIGQHRNKEFQQMWEQVIKEYAVRWGDTIHAWWVDCAYYIDSMYLPKDEPNQYSLARALKAGNPKIEIALNPGTRTQVKPHLDIETFSAGELDYFLAISGYRPMGKTRWFNTSEAMKGKQVFFLTFLGQWWGWGAPRFPDELVYGYTKHIINRGGKMTWDMPIGTNGLIDKDALRQIKLLKKL